MVVWSAGLKLGPFTEGEALELAWKLLEGRKANRWLGSLGT